MVIYRSLLSALLLVIALLLIDPGASWAATYQGNQAIDQPATLIGPEPDTQISIYPKPATQPGPVGYGVSGDSVTVLEQVGSNQGTIWDAIRFNNPPYAQGWVQAKFVSLPTATSQNVDQQSSAPPRYLGNQQSSSNAQGQQPQQQYSQQQY